MEVVVGGLFKVTDARVRGVFGGVLAKVAV